ncbi:hypothetical protein M9M90_02305 [Phenylobacterium sp. LH3H17]|uniref:hypothetical protein n=1 Tax=Phenylobacterium sp. LH3H17 TaxID=2903901 RepID=UPI0020C9ABD0|nr:hypothetical protein [Phenylobacterium sp. LH3H17]UTP40027.1 hypothetical protein M9M90_02305 [Phenylobacterium sp. LH3H17]
MILKKAVYFAVAVAALAAAAVVCVVALAMALHAAVLPSVGPAWASVIVAGAATVVMAILAAILLIRANPPKKLRVGGQEKDLTSRVFELARDKPWVAAGVVAAAAAVALKNPKITAAVVSAVMAGRASKK